MRIRLAIPRHALMDALSELIGTAGLRVRLDQGRFGDGVAADAAHASAREIVFHLVLLGDCVLDRPNASPIEMHPGHFVALPTGTPHRVRSLCEPDAMRHLVLDARAIGRSRLRGRFTYESRAIDALLASLPGVLSVSPGDEESRGDLLHIVTQIRAELEGERPGAATIVAALCTALLALALRVNSARDATAPGLLRLVGDPRLARSARAILEQPGRDWTLADLAHQATMSRATFARQFRQIAAMTPGEFLLRARMSHAAGLLASTRSAPSDIGIDVGYRSEAAFAKAFKRVMGAPPASYRRKLHTAG